MITEGVHEAGQAKCIVRQRKNYDGMEMILLLYRNNRGYYVTFDDGSIMLNELDEGVALTDEHIVCAWANIEDINDGIEDIFTVMAMGMGMNGDTKSAYEKGVLAGANDILRRWVDQKVENTRPIFVFDKEQGWASNQQLSFPGIGDEHIHVGTNDPAIPAHLIERARQRKEQVESDTIKP